MGVVGSPPADWGFVVFLFISCLNAVQEYKKLNVPKPSEHAERLEWERRWLLQGKRSTGEGIYYS